MRKTPGTSSIHPLLYFSFILFSGISGYERAVRLGKTEAIGGQKGCSEKYSTKILFPKFIIVFWFYLGQKCTTISVISSKINKVDFITINKVEDILQISFNLRIFFTAFKMSNMHGRKSHRNIPEIPPRQFIQRMLTTRGEGEKGRNTIRESVWRLWFTLLPRGSCDTLCPWTMNSHLHVTTRGKHGESRNCLHYLRSRLRLI